MPDLKPLPKPVDMRKPLRHQQRPSVKPAVKPAVKVVQPYTPKYAKQRRPTPVEQQVSGAYRFARKHRLVGLGAAFIIAVSLISLMIWSMSGTNAFAIYLGDERFGYIAFSQEIDQSAVLAEAISRLEAREGVQVLVNERLTLVPASSRNILPYTEAIEQLADAFTFRIVGTAIEINGNRVAVLRSRGDAEEVARRLQAPHLRRDHADYHSVQFLEDFQLVSATVEEEALATIEYVLGRLDRRVSFVDQYIVRDGDTLGAIALRHGTTLAQLYEDNPGFSPATILRVGDVLRIQSYRPYLSVSTVEAITRTEPIPIENIYLENPALDENFSQIIQDGEEGRREIVEHITRINGIQMGPAEIITYRVIQDMTNNIIEVGA